MRRGLVVIRLEVVFEVGVGRGDGKERSRLRITLWIFFTFEEY